MQLLRIKLSVHDLMASQLVCTSQESVQHGGTNRNGTCSNASQQEWHMQQC